MKNLSAYTAPGADYPAYISINEDDAGGVRVSVRGPSSGGEEGQMAEVALTRDEATEVLNEALARLTGFDG